MSTADCAGSKEEDRLLPPLSRSETNPSVEATPYQRLRLAGDLLVSSSNDLPEVPPSCGTRLGDVRRGEVSLPRVAGSSCGSAIQFCAHEERRGREGVLREGTTLIPGHEFETDPDTCPSPFLGFALGMPARNRRGSFKERLFKKRCWLDVGSDLDEVSRRLLVFADLGDGDECATITPAVADSNPYAVLEKAPTDCCSRTKVLDGKARTLVRWYEHLGLRRKGYSRSGIQCSELRTAVRSCFDTQLPVEWELSFKTISKIDADVCSFCGLNDDDKIDEWKQDRMADVEYNEEHLALFEKCVSMNVPDRWDDRRTPFMPSGNATCHSSRRKGGNWNEEEFSDECIPKLVWSKGKPRVVTLYSEYNTRVLTPLHHSLYTRLRKRDWLLVGDPRDEHVQSLNGGGDYVSIDYSQATDRVKSRYVQILVKVLKQKSCGMSEEEERCLDVLSELRFDGSLAQSGQPMGSVMSFPMLCIINKTNIDMSLGSLMDSGRIGLEEYRSIRLKINGDDGLIKEPRAGEVMLLDAVRANSAEIGLCLNVEKTMVDSELAEINSTLFRKGVLVKKFNASAIWMKPEMEDVLGFAHEASTDLETFRKIVRGNLHILRSQECKNLHALPYYLQMVCRRDKRIRAALVCVPVRKRPAVVNPFPVEAEPEGFFLPLDRRDSAVSGAIDKARPGALERAGVRRARFRTRVVDDAVSFSSLLKVPPAGPAVTLSCYVEAWREELRERNSMEDERERGDLQYEPAEILESGKGSLITRMELFIRDYKELVSTPPRKSVSESKSGGDDFIPFT